MYMYFQIIYLYSRFLNRMCKFQDVYVIAALIFLGLQAAQNATMTALSHFMDDSEVDYFDKWSMVTMAMLLIIFHAIFAAFIYRTVSFCLFRCSLCMKLAVFILFLCEAVCLPKRKKCPDFIKSHTPMLFSSVLC